MSAEKEAKGADALSTDPKSKLEQQNKAHIAHQLSQKSIPTASLSPMKQRPGALKQLNQPGNGLSVSTSQVFNVSQQVASPVKTTTGANLRSGASQAVIKQQRGMAISQRQNQATTGKKSQSTTAKKPEKFSLAPYHEQIMASNNQPSEEEEQSEYDDYGSDRDPSNDSYWFTSSDEDDDDGELDAEEIAYRQNRMTMFAAYTHYDVIKEVAKFNFEYHLTKRENCAWDIAWYDGPITIKLLQRMQPYQRTNHFPGIYNLAKKNMLGRHLMRLQSVFPDDYNFFPPTYNLPADFKEFLTQVNQKRNRTFIVKPEASCQGKGIFLTRDPESLTTEKTILTTQNGVVEHMVVQRYMHKPYLIDGYKFDLRIYVLVNGISPLRVYVYKDGLARFATVKYQSPAPSNLNNLCMHLTNYAINKESTAFVQNSNAEADDQGSKRSYQFVLKKLADDFGLQTMDRVKNEINEIIVKTMCLAQPHVHHLYRSCQPDDIENSLCFQILGFDIMIDHKLKPSLIEVNQMPSFQTDSPLDYKIKQGVINDCMSLLNLSAKRRNRIKNQKRAELQRRLLKGYSHKIPANQVQKAPQHDNDSQATVSKPHTGNIEDGAANQASSQGGNPALNKTASRSVLGTTQGREQQKGMPQVVSKANMRNLAMQSKQDLILKKRLIREKNEAALCGGYELIYPFVTYEEEEQIRQQVDRLKSQGVNGRSVRAQIGLDAPKTLKEKIAEKNEPLSGAKTGPKESLGARKSSQQSLKEGVEQRVPQLGENTIEMTAIEKLMEQDVAANDGNQQGHSGGGQLAERWLKQMKYENFMECARKMWDQFTSGANVKQQRRLRARAEAKEKEQADLDKKEKAKRDAARKNLTLKLRRQAEERRQRQEERIKMMRSIEEENEREPSPDSPREKGLEKLNMAELKEQHKKLTDKINESQKKVLEDGLRRARDRRRSNKDRVEVRKSINTLELSADNPLPHRISSQNVAGPQTEKKAANPNMDYFKHVQSKYQEKQQKRMLDSMQQEKQRVLETTGMTQNQTSSEAVGKWSKTQTKPATAHQASNTSIRTATEQKANATQANYDEAAQKQKEQKPKNTEFPLDLVLPVFNLNKKEGTFIPTLKMKQKDQKETPGFKDPNTKKGIFKGSTIQHHHGPVEPKSVLGEAVREDKSAASPSPRRYQLLNNNASSDAPLATIKSPQAGYTSRERKSNNAPELIATQEYRAGERPPPPKRFTQHVIQPPTNMPVLDSFRPLANQRDLIESNLNLIQKIGGGKKNAHQIAMSELISDQGSAGKYPQSQFKSLDPVGNRLEKYQTPAQDSKVRENAGPHVQLINLSMKPTTIGSKHDLIGSGLKPTFKSPQVDLSHKLTGNLREFTGHAHSLHHKSTKMQSMASNVLSNMPYQRNSKLNELFGDLPKLEQRGKSNAVGEGIPVNSRLNSQKANQSTMNQSTLNYMEQIMSQGKKNNAKPQTIPHSQGNNQKGSLELVTKSIKIEGASFPEISDQHKSRELVGTKTRAASNQSQMHFGSPSDFGVNKTHHRDGSAHIRQNPGQIGMFKRNPIETIDQLAIMGQSNQNQPSKSIQPFSMQSLKANHRKALKSFQNEAVVLGQSNGHQQADSTSMGPTYGNDREGAISPEKRGFSINLGSANQSQESIGNLQPKMGLDIVSGISMRQQKEALRNAGLGLQRDSKDNTSSFLNQFKR